MRLTELWPFGKHVEKCFDNVHCQVTSNHVEGLIIFEWGTFTSAVRRFRFEYIIILIYNWFLYCQHHIIKFFYTTCPLCAGDWKYRFYLFMYIYRGKLWHVRKTAICIPLQFFLGWGKTALIQNFLKIDMGENGNITPGLRKSTTCMYIILLERYFILKLIDHLQVKTNKGIDTKILRKSCPLIRGVLG